MEVGQLPTNVAILLAYTNAYEETKFHMEVAVVTLRIVLRKISYTALISAVLGRSCHRLLILTATMGTSPSKPQQARPSVELRPSILKSLCHPLVEQVSKEVDEYFSQHWPFKDDKTRKKFISQGIPRVTCLYCAKALDDRIAFACKLITITFLTDGKCIMLRLNAFPGCELALTSDS